METPCAYAVGPLVLSAIALSLLLDMASLGPPLGLCGPFPPYQDLARGFWTEGKGPPVLFPPYQDLARGFWTEGKGPPVLFPPYQDLARGFWTEGKGPPVLFPPYRDLARGFWTEGKGPPVLFPPPPLGAFRGVPMLLLSSPCNFKASACASPPPHPTAFTRARKAPSAPSPAELYPKQRTGRGGAGAGGARKRLRGRYAGAPFFASWVAKQAGNLLTV